jgi:hypothetical protein
MGQFSAAGSIAGETIESEEALPESGGFRFGVMLAVATIAWIAFLVLLVLFVQRSTA